MAHVELPGDVGRRDDDAEGLAVGTQLRTEDAGAFPALVPLRFDPLWVVRRLHRPVPAWGHDDSAWRHRSGRRLDAGRP
jgi:hypothetical protein